MAEAPKVAPKGVQPVRIVGRIEDVRRVSGQNGPAFMHLVKLPAADEFSSPASVLVKAQERCGDEGATFDRMVVIGGYGRSYQVNDEETGRKRTVRTADNTLTVVG